MLPLPSIWRRVAGNRRDRRRSAHHTPTQGQKRHAGRTALLVLDTQVDFISARGRWPVAQEQVPQLIRNINRLIAACGDRSWLPVCIFNRYQWWNIANPFRNFAAIGDDPGGRPDPRIDVRSAARFAKSRGDAFANRRLVDFCDEHTIDEVVITGVFAEACVACTALGAMPHAIRPVVVTDAIAGASARITQTALASMRSHGVVLATCAELLSWPNRI